MFFNVKKINDNLLLVNNQKIKKKVFLNLYNECKNRDYSSFFQELEKYFNFKFDENMEKIHEIALPTQIVIKKSKMMYLHGFVLYIALCNYLSNNEDIDNINIVETGTARGFSSLCMALALKKFNRKGKIHTIDVIPANVSMYWNCIKDFENQYTRFELLNDWKELVDEYIIFHTGKSLKVLHKLNLNRIHFSFLDAQHDYKNLSYELNWVKNKQKKGDMIICDDYTVYNNGKYQFPGIIRAVNEFINIFNYNYKFFYGNDGEKRRGYVYLQMN